VGRGVSQRYMPMASRNSSTSRGCSCASTVKRSVSDRMPAVAPTYAGNGHAPAPINDVHAERNAPARRATRSLSVERSRRTASDGGFHTAHHGARSGHAAINSSQDVALGHDDTGSEWLQPPAGTFVR
jgi:hypothetical protein